MKKTERYQVHTVLESDPSRFDEKYNAIMTELAEAGALVQKPQPYRDNDGLFCAVINYTVTTVQYDDIREQYEDRGERYYCTNCPHYRRDLDGRWRGGFCHIKRRIDPGAAACLAFYEELAAGEIDPIKED